MRMLVFADIHGDFETAGRVFEKIDTSTVDLIICPGDITDMFSIPEGFSQMAIADIVLQQLLSLGKPVLCIPGNHDPYDVVALFEEFKVDLHNRVKKINGISFMGWGGAPTPFHTNFEPPPWETKEALDKMHKKLRDEDFILVVHNPPRNTHVDKTISGAHVGSSTIREFIIKSKPMLCLSAHIHEARGEDVLGKTRLFYPGALFEGFYGIVDIDEKRPKTDKNRIKCEIKKV